MIQQRARPKLLLRWLATLVILGLVFAFIDGSALVSRLASVPLPFVILALCISVVQVMLSAWRWRYTAARLGVGIPMSFAVREYYLASFLNQVLPGGVMGDVNRAWRHSKLHTASTSERSENLAAIHAVALERLSGQIVLVPVVLLVMAALWLGGQFSAQGLQAQVSLSPMYWLLAPILLGSVGWLLFVSGKVSALVRYARRLGGDLYRAFAGWQAGIVQLTTSLAVLVTYLLVFVLITTGMGLATDFASLALVAGLCLALLLAMVLPVTVSGWGVREGAAALLWPAAGLPAEQGVAISVGYGTLIFLGSLPGALMLLRKS
ncbi:lysylphosphatidylglycerol synthase transmembrane domain-containing protein [Marinobacter sp.]|uniref:lysylphosphatidylglycerol synthase transmembrane domain-containing protein n=1 Tax=Marinobacter sp. TaxID=50741 RepID=UPI001A0E5B98|nr:lysylphosphatidylglycerol synthase transmembrane domain-containing protein [Marinobacter sp.]MBE0486449.1 flippase-like domain-containing protein [Marinobacter sp.]